MIEYLIEYLIALASVASGCVIGLLVVAFVPVPRTVRAGRPVKVRLTADVSAYMSAMRQAHD